MALFAILYCLCYILSPGTPCIILGTAAVRTDTDYRANIRGHIVHHEKMGHVPRYTRCRRPCLASSLYFNHRHYAYDIQFFLFIHVMLTVAFPAFTTYQYTG